MTRSQVNFLVQEKNSPICLIYFISRERCGWCARWHFSETGNEHEEMAGKVLFLKGIHPRVLDPSKTQNCPIAPEKRFSHGHIKFTLSPLPIDNKNVTHPICHLDTCTNTDVITFKAVIIMKGNLWYLMIIYDDFLSRQYLLRNLQAFEYFVPIDAKNVLIFTHLKILEQILTRQRVIIS